MQMMEKVPVEQRLFPFSTPPHPIPFHEHFWVQEPRGQQCPSLGASVRLGLLSPTTLCLAGEQGEE